MSLPPPSLRKSWSLSHGPTISHFGSAALNVPIPALVHFATGRVLISVHADNSEWSGKAKKVFKDCDGEDIGSSGEAGAETKSPVGAKKDNASASRARGTY